VSALVEFRGVEFGYAAPAARRARGFQLASLSLAVERGEILGVIGPNSAGKTTLIRLLTRVVRPPLCSRVKWQSCRRSCRTRFRSRWASSC
jgi:ABC-type multidrug transport system ATPase subunit